METLTTYIDKARKDLSSQREELANFIDDFRRTKDINSILDRVEQTDRVSFLFAATAHQLCIELSMTIPSWLKEFHYLKDPYFVSEIDDFKFLALRDSPPAFKIRNIFITKNFLSRA